MQSRWVRPGVVAAVLALSACDSIKGSPSPSASGSASSWTPSPRTPSSTRPSTSTSTSTPSSTSTSTPTATSSATASASAAPSSSATAKGGIEARKADLRERGLALLAAIKAHDAKKVETALVDFSGTREKADAWFKQTFGYDRGEELTKEWDATIAKHLPELVIPFRDALEKGQTDVIVTAYEGENAPEANPIQRAALGAMRTPAALYTLTLAKPGEKTGFSLWSFAYTAEGRFLLVGKMGKAKG